MYHRKLFVLEINDQSVENFRSGSGLAHHFVLKHLRSWIEVQKDLASGNPFRPDIILFDISFEFDDSINGLDVTGTGIPEGSAVVPVGPLLALPYVALRPVCVVSLFSQYFKNPAVRNQPLVVLSSGLLFARMTGQVRPSATLQGRPKQSTSGLASPKMAVDATSVEAYLEHEIEPSTDPASALEEAFDLYIKQLQESIQSRRVIATNMVQLRRWVESLRDELLASDLDRIPVPEDWFIEISNGSAVDRLQWRSVCADLLHFTGNDIDIHGVENMLSWLGEVMTDPAFDVAVSLVREQNATAVQEPPRPRPRADALIAERCGNSTAEDRREILRLMVLFAHAHAWARRPSHTGTAGDLSERDKKSTNPTASLYDRLGVDKNGHTYRSWFGDRSTREQPSLVCSTTIRIRPLDLFDPGRGRDGRFLLWGQTELSARDQQRLKNYLVALADEDCYDLVGPNSVMAWLCCPRPK